MATRRRISPESRRVLNSIARAEGRRSKEIVDAFSELVARYSDQIDEEAILRFLSTGSLPSATPEFRAFAEDVLKPAWSEMIDLGATTVDPALSVRGILSHDAYNRHVSKWIEERAFESVTRFSDSQRRAVSVVVNGMRERGESVEEIARTVRGSVGLAERQAIALERMEREMTEQGATRREIVRAVSARRRQMEMHRANMIARTELQSAANEGIVAAAVAEQEERNDGKQPRMFIEAYPDCCDDCREIEDNQPEDGISVHGEWDSHGRPPFHPNCRCLIVVKWLTL